MKAWVFFYNMKGAKEKTTVLEQLFGKMKRSNYKYEYEIKGKLPKKEYIKPVRSVIIVKKKFVKELSTFFESYKIKYEVREIKLKRGDFEKKPFL